MLSWRILRLDQVTSLLSATAPTPLKSLDGKSPRMAARRDGLVMSPARAQQTSRSAIVFSRLKQPTQTQAQSQMRPVNTQPTTPTQLNST